MRASLAFLLLVLFGVPMPAKSFDQTTWKFPIDKIHVQRAVLCMTKDAAGHVHCVGARLECESMPLPDINSGYDRTRKVKPEIDLELTTDLTSLDSLAGQILELGQPVESCSDDLGSIYLFGAHNPVGWQRISFGHLNGKTLEATFDLLFDFTYEDRIGGRFRHTLKGPVRIERRWLLKP